MWRNEISIEEEDYLLNAAVGGEFIELQNKLIALPATVDIKSIKEIKGNSLLHLAVESNSLQCVQTVVKFARFHEFDVNNHGDNPLHHAVKVGSSLQIINFLAEYCPLFMIMANADQNWPSLIAMSAANSKATYLLREKEVVYDLQEYCHGLPFRGRLDSHLQFVYTTFPEPILNSFYSNLFGEHTGYFKEEELIFIFFMLTQNNVRKEYKDWIVRRVYLHRSNILNKCVRAVIDMKFNDFISNRYQYYNENELKYCIIFLLHSNHFGNMSRILQLSSTHQIAFQFCYFSLFVLSLNDRPLWKQIVRILNDMWSLDQHQSQRLHSANFITHILPQEISSNKMFFRKFMEFLADIEAKHFNFIQYFENCHYKQNLLMGVKLFLPFIAVPTADDIIPYFLSNKNRPTMENFLRAELRANGVDFSAILRLDLSSIPYVPNYIDCSSIADYCDQPRQTKPMSLQKMCRVEIRRSVFEANSKDTNAQKLDKLNSLRVPVSIRNFLFYNDTKYELCK